MQLTSCCTCLFKNLKKPSTNSYFFHHNFLYMSPSVQKENTIFCFCYFLTASAPLKFHVLTWLFYGPTYDKKLETEIEKQTIFWDGKISCEP